MVYEFVQFMNRIARGEKKERVAQTIMKRVDSMFKKYTDSAKTVNQLRYHAKVWYMRNSLQGWRNRLRFNLGAVGEQLKYGYQMGPEILIATPIGASEIFKHAGGRFVKNDGSGRAEVADSGDTELIGWMEPEIGEATASSTEGADKGVVNISQDAVYRVPVSSTATYANTARWNAADLLVTSDVQEVDLTSNEDVVWIVDGDETNSNWADVQLASPKVHATGV